MPNKLLLDDLVSLQNEVTATNKINENSRRIEVAIENTLSRDGSAPNAMRADLDMNSQRILNLPAPVADTEPARHGDIAGSVTAAAASATSAAASATSATASATSATSSATSATASDTSATASASSATTSATSAAASAVTAAAASENPAIGYNFDSSTTDADPGNGDFRLNHATPASATAVYFDNVDSDGNTQTGWLDNFDDSSTTNKGILTIRQISSATAFVTYRVTGTVTDGTGYRKVTVSNLAAGAGAFTNGSRCSVLFSISGDVGIIGGSTGATDNAVLRADGVGGAAVQSSGVTINDSGVIVLPAAGLQVGSSVPFSDSAGTLTLQNVDVLDATTEATIEAAIDTLANLTSVQGQTVTLAGALITSGANSLTLTTTGATNVTLPVTGTLSTLAGSETLTTKTINLTSNTLTGTTAQFNTALSDNDFATLAGSETLTTKTINLTSNTLTGTTAQFNTALSDNDFATLAGSETLTTKTINLTSNTLTGTTAQFNTANSDADFYTSGGTDVIVADGGTGLSATTAYAVLCGGTTSTAALQSIAGVGTAGQLLTSNGAGALPTFQSGGGGGFTSIVIQTFTASGTYTPTSGMDYCIVYSTGGGGGSGGSDGNGTTGCSGSGGGGAGGTCIETFSAATIGASQTVTIGAAGAAGSATGGTGGTGGTTTLGALHSAVGGVGGGGSGSAPSTAVICPGGAGGVPTGGTANITGGSGGAGSATVINIVEGILFGGIFGGTGGASIWGGGGTGAVQNAGGTTVGSAGVAYGSGGGGSTNQATAAGSVGAVGAAGFIMVIEYM